MSNGRKPDHLADPTLWVQFVAGFQLNCTNWQISASESSPASGHLVFADPTGHWGLELHFQQRKSWHISLRAVTWFELAGHRHSWRVSCQSLGLPENHIWYLSEATQIPRILQELQQDIAVLYEPFWQATSTPTAALRWVLDSDTEIRLDTAHIYGKWHKARVLLRHLPESEQQALAPEFEDRAAKMDVKWLQ